MMELKVEVPEPLVAFVRERAARGDQSASDVVSQALMLLHDRDAEAPEDAAWLREALNEVDPSDEGEELDLAGIIRAAEARLSGRRGEG